MAEHPRLVLSAEEGHSLPAVGQRHRKGKRPIATVEDDPETMSSVVWAGMRAVLAGSSRVEGLMDRRFHPYSFSRRVSVCVRVLCGAPTTLSWSEVCIPHSTFGPYVRYDTGDFSAACRRSKETGHRELSSPECVEGVFSEVRMYGVLRGSALGFGRWHHAYG